MKLGQMVGLEDLMADPPSEEQTDAFRGQGFPSVVSLSAIRNGPSALGLHPLWALPSGPSAKANWP